MAALAGILKDAGHAVEGSDIEKYIFTQDSLEEREIPFYPFDENLIENQDLIIAGLSFREDHPEIKKAREKKIPVYWYNDYLGEFLKDYTSVCIAGCHGKSTTTGMMAAIFADEPSGYLIGDGQGHLKENAETFVLESCEYQRHFLAYHPDYAIITNIELDHVDYYKDLDDYISAFQSFINQIKKTAVINGDDPVLNGLSYPCKKVTFGFNRDNDYTIRNLTDGVEGIGYDLYQHDQKIGSVSLKQSGKVYAYDSAAAFVMGLELGVKPDVIEQALHNYHGIHRRFEISEAAGSVLVDDYAHHPTAIRSMIEAMRSRYPGQKIIALYKPDRFSRLQVFLDDFAEALNTADESVIFDFPSNAVREDETVTVTIQDLLDRLENGSLKQIDEKSAAWLAEKNPAVFLFMSSKDIYLLRDMTLEKLQTLSDS